MDGLPPSAMRPAAGEWSIVPTGYPRGGFHVVRPCGAKIGAGNGAMPRCFASIAAAVRAIPASAR